MIKTFADVPGWSFKIDEVSAGVYEVIATDSAGRRVQSTGTDPDALMEECRSQAISIIQAVASR